MVLSSLHGFYTNAKEVKLIFSASSCLQVISLDLKFGSGYK